MRASRAPCARAQVNALKAQGIFEKTAIVFTSKHGNSPINHTQLVKVPPKSVTGLIDAAISGTIAQIEDDTGA